jgi:hypothetical protein
LGSGNIVNDVMARSKATKHPSLSPSPMRGRAVKFSVSVRGEPVEPPAKRPFDKLRANGMEPIFQRT